MWPLPPSVRLYVASAPCDFRKGLDGLAALVTSLLCLDALSGHLFVFFNARRDQVKILWWDRTGYALCTKRLARGTFAWLAPGAADATYREVPMADLLLLLEGIELAAGKRRVRWHAPAPPARDAA